VSGWTIQLLTKDGTRKVKDSDPLQGTIQDHEDGRRLQESEPATPFICNWEDRRQVPETGVPVRVITPLWQVTPLPASGFNVNLLSDERVVDLYATMIKTNQSVLSNVSFRCSTG
jgi:hypothetical protein